MLVNVTAYGNDISEFDIELTENEYAAVSKFVNALNDTWAMYGTDVPSIGMEIESR